MKKEDAKAFIIPESSTIKPVYKVEHWIGPCKYSLTWKRTHCHLYETEGKARLGLSNTKWSGEHLRVLFVMCNNKWVEITRILDEYFDET